VFVCSESGPAAWLPGWGLLIWGCRNRVAGGWTGWGRLTYYAVEVANGVVRVGVDVTPLLGRRTGVGNFVTSLVEGFANNAAVRLKPYSVTARGWRSPEVKTSQRWPMPARPLRELWRRSNAAPIEWWTGPLDIVHGTNFVVPPSKRAVQLVSVHDMTTVRLPELCTRDTLQYPGLLRRAIARGAHVHTDSAFVAAEVTEHFAIDPARVHTIHLGLPATIAPAMNPAVGENFATPSRQGPPYLLAIGTIEPRKDYPSLLRAFALLAPSHPDLRLRIVGQKGWGEQAYSESLGQLPKQISARIDLRGFVDDHERTTLLLGASLLVYPSVYEGFGLPPLEAMAAGVPVVATTAGSLPEILGDAALLVASGDHTALAEAIQRVLTDSQLASNLVEKGLFRAADFTVDTMISRFTSLYQELPGNS
jgi:glycosyltransferase involved in cell wall biosynthesis